jgi:hypothetical protein
MLHMTSCMVYILHHPAWLAGLAFTVRLLKGTVQRDFLSPIFSLIESSQAPYSVFKDFSNLASNSVGYSRFLIDSPQYFIAESPYSPYCLLRRVVTLRIILAGSHHLLALSAKNSHLSFNTESQYFPY